MILPGFQTFIPYLYNNTIFDTKTSENQGFKDYILKTPNISDQYANILVGTLPEQRYDYYANPNYEEIKQNVLSELSKIDSALGFFSIMSNPNLLQELEPYSYAVMFIGLIFDLLLIIFIVVSILLIYSLLLISVETKTFEIGVMRLIGLTKGGFIAMIITQSCMFVFPAVILSFASAPPLIYLLFKSLFSSSLGYMPSVAPSAWAVVRALAIGVFIPLISSIIPIRRALSTNLTDALNANRSKSSAV